MGGKRRLMKQKKARRKLNGIFNTVATKTPDSATLAKQFQILNTVAPISNPPRRHRGIASHVQPAPGGNSIIPPRSTTAANPISLDILALRMPEAFKSPTVQHQQLSNSGNNNRQPPPPPAKSTSLYNDDNGNEEEQQGSVMSSTPKALSASGGGGESMFAASQR